VPKLAKFLVLLTLMVALGLATRAPAFGQAPDAAASPAMPLAFGALAGFAGRGNGRLGAFCHACLRL